MHGENRMWKLLCWLLLWDEAIFAPGADAAAGPGRGPPHDVWVHPYQMAPLDLHTEDFEPCVAGARRASSPVAADVTVAAGGGKP